MAAEYRHKRYFRIRKSDSSLATFSSTADANTKIGFKSVYNTSSPTKTEALEDSNQTLVVTYEFDSDVDQTAFKDAVTGAWGDNTQPFSPDDTFDTVEHFKTVWLHQDGSVSNTTNF